jgi:phosphate transport system ATP-binding protein
MNAITTILTHAREELAQKEFSFSRPESFVIDDKFAHLTDARLSTKDLNVYINGNHILKNVNVNIPKNRITCIIGPSGCGKSTLLRTFNRLNDSVEGLKMKGEVNLGGSNILSANSSKLSDLRRNIGLVPQRPCPLPMSIYDNVAYGCRIHGIRNHRKLDIIVRHYLQAVGLWGDQNGAFRSPSDCLRKYLINMI